MNLYVITDSAILAVMKTLNLAIFSFLILCSGCAGKSQIFDSNLSEQGSGSLFFLSQSARTSQIEQLLYEKKVVSESDKINYLLRTIAISRCVFIRNGARYDSMQAAKWLSWKMGHKQYASNPIVTAEDFINRVSNGSKRSGKTYLVVIGNNAPTKLDWMLHHELAELEQASLNRTFEASPANLTIPAMTSSDATKSAVVSSAVVALAR